MYHRTITSGTVFYLLLPNLLFLGAWFKPIIGLPVVLLAVLVWYSIVKNTERNAPKLDVPPIVSPSLGQHIALAIIAMMICLFSGIGGFVFQGDFEKHYAMLHDLVYLDWPVIYQKSQGQEVSFHLNYYFAYFLPPAALAKILGAKTVDNLIIIWSAIGLYLSFLWFIKLSKSQNIIWALCFLLFLGGQDFLYAWLKLQVHSFTGDTLNATQIFEQEIRTVCVFHNTILRYPTNFFAISWAPQHLIGGWLVSGLLLDNYQNKGTQRYMVFFVSLLPLWSVFNAIGMLPIIFAGIYQNSKKIFTWENSIGLLFFLVIFIFFAAHEQVSDKGPIWEYIAPAQLAFKWPIFILFEFGYITLFIYYFDFFNKYRIIFYISVITLIILPVYVIGNMNDLLMRAAVPSLFALYLIAYNTFIKIKYTVKYAVIVLVFIGVLLPQIITISAHLPGIVSFHLAHGFTESRVRVSSSKSISDLTGENWFNSQYFGAYNSFYIQYLAPLPDK
jgi:hypothetical protein